MGQTSRGSCLLGVLVVGCISIPSQRLAFAEPPAPAVKSYLQRTERDIVRNIRDLDWEGALGLAEDILFRLPGEPIGLKWLGVILDGVGLKQDAAIILSALNPTVLGEAGSAALKSAVAATCEVVVEVSAPPDDLPEVERRLQAAVQSLLIVPDSTGPIAARLSALRHQGFIPERPGVVASRRGSSVTAISATLVPAVGRRTLDFSLGDLRLDSPAMVLELVPGARATQAIVVLPYLQVSLVGLQPGDRLLVGGHEISVDSGVGFVPPDTTDVEIARGRRFLRSQSVTIDPAGSNRFVLPATLVLHSEAGDRIAVSMRGKSLAFDQGGTLALEFAPDQEFTLELGAPMRITRVLKDSLTAGQVKDVNLRLSDFQMRPEWVAYQDDRSDRTLAWALTIGGMAASAVAVGAGATSVGYKSDRDAAYSRYMTTTTSWDELAAAERATKEAHDKMTTWGWVSGGAALVATSLLVVGIYMLADTPSAVPPPEEAAVSVQVWSTPSGAGGSMNVSF